MTRTPDREARFNSSPRPAHRGHRRTPRLERLEDRTLMAVLTVNTTSDNNVGGNALSLRAAISLVNDPSLLSSSATQAEKAQVTGTLGVPGTPDVVHFAIPGSGVQTIAPATPLPTIASPLIIDGYSQPGTRRYDPADGRDAVLLIQVNGYSLPPGAAGLDIRAGSSTVSGLVFHGFNGAPDAYSTAIALRQNGGNTIEGNFIGTDASGDLAPDGPAFVGTTPREINYGIHVLEGSSFNRIGATGNNPGQRNVISGLFMGIVLRGPAHDNVVAGNFIGTNSAGTATLGNYVGISTLQGNHDDVLGTNDNVAAERNLVSGNLVGIAFGSGFGAPTFNCQAVGNLIGTDIHGQPLGNVGTGLLACFGAHDLTIRDNTIANNGHDLGNGPGVLVANWFATPYNVRIHANRILNNAGLGIDVAQGGVTFGALPEIDGVNDPGQPDGPGTGANDLQHYPVLNSIQGGPVTSISGSLSSNNTGPFTIDFYAGPTANPSGYEEGARYLGSASIGSVGPFSLDLPATTTPGEWITATATDASGNTSEFSLAVQAGSIDNTRLKHALDQNGGAVTLSTTSNSAVTTAVQGVNALSSPLAGTTETVTLDLRGGTFTTDTHVNTQPGVVLVIVNGTLIGGSPALIVDSGVVFLDHVTALNATNAPTILVNGGSLKVRNSTIQESTGFNQIAIQVTGGTVDLGTTSDPGGNTINVNGTGDWVHNSSPNPVSAVGDLFTINGVVTPPSSLSGVVFADFNADGQVDFGERGISGVTVRLDGTDFLGNPVHLSQPTDDAGAYVFQGLRPGSYTISEAQPAGYTQGINSIGTGGGSVSGDSFTLALAANSNALTYNYGERPAAGGTVRGGQTAGIGFWNNRNGQALIQALNGGATSTQLGNWLATTFPHMFGRYAGGNDLAGRGNSYVATFFQTLFVVHGQKLDAQVMATALSVYVTNATLDNTGIGARYGFTVSGNGAGTATYNVGANGEAFGVANNTVMTLMDILLAADAQAVNGVLYNGNTTRRNKANTVFSAINEVGGI